MSRFRLLFVREAQLVAVTLFCGTAHALTYNFTHDFVTYTVVEPDPFFSGGTAGNTVRINNPGQFWAHDAPANIDGLYHLRDFNALWLNQPAGAAQGDPDLVEISGQDVMPPDLRTTISGLPNNTYDVYLFMLVEALRPDNPIHPATLGADLDIGQSAPTTLRGGRSQQGMINTGIIITPDNPGYEVALAPLGQVTGTEIKVLVGPMWAGDLNHDGVNNQDDLNIVLSHWFELVPPGDRSMGDTNGDGFITQADINSVVYEAWGEKGYPPGRRGDYIGIAYKPSGSGSGSSSGIPEPSAIVMLIGGIAVLVACQRRARKLAPVAIGLIIASLVSPPVALASITGTFVQVTSEGGQSPPANRVSQDLSVNATTDWLGAQLRILPTSGTAPRIYQDFNGGSPNPAHAPPDPNLFGTFPTLRFDTYLTGSGGVAGGAATSAGAAIDIGGTNNISTGGTWGNASIDMQWYTTNTADIGTFTLGRFTLHNTVQGTWLLRLDSKDQTAPFLLNGNIENGLLIAAPAGVQGDYNNNGTVDAGDYVAWRKGGTLANEVDTPGTINAADYTAWRARFGNPLGAGSGLSVGSAVPEPSGAILILAGLMFMANSCRTSLKRHSK